MYLDDTNSDIAIDELKEPISETLIGSVKEKLNSVEISRFNWTPEHLEQLLREWHTLSDTPHTFLKNWVLELQENKTVLLDNNISVYFTLEMGDNEKISKVYIFNWKIKQEISPQSHYLLYLNFINIYNKLTYSPLKKNMNK